MTGQAGRDRRRDTCFVIPSLRGIRFPCMLLQFAMSIRGAMVSLSTPSQISTSSPSQEISSSGANAFISAMDRTPLCEK